VSACSKNKKGDNLNSVRLETKRTLKKRVRDKINEVERNSKNINVGDNSGICNKGGLGWHPHIYVCFL
jgi:hypothetical protein